MKVTHIYSAPPDTTEAKRVVMEMLREKVPTLCGKIRPLVGIEDMEYPVCVECAQRIEGLHRLEALYAEADGTLRQLLRKQNEAATRLNRKREKAARRESAHREG